ncbi:MAG: hypothetical protein LBR27_05030 [Bifidobacteriaceae bacterium]|jgi:hypothetical protein|nr:hypothetical protein [Bifidobacteriaceae bacterium]
MTTSHSGRPWRQLASLAAAFGLLAAGAVTGLTLATYVDGEYGAAAYGAGAHNLQVSLDNATWQETALDGVTSDNVPDTGVLTPLDLGGSTRIVPGDPMTGYQATYWVRNAPTSTTASRMVFELVDQGGSDAALLASLRFDVAVDGAGVLTDQTFSQLSATGTPLLLDQAAAPGTAHQITLKATIPDQGDRASNWALAEQTVHLLLAVYGSSVPIT